MMYPGLSDPRVVVVQAEASPGVLLPWIPVGVALWDQHGPQLAIHVQLTFSWKGIEPAAQGTATLAASQEPLSAARGGGQAVSLSADNTLLLHGRSPAGPRAIRLPDLVPTVTVDSASRAAEPVDVACDTVWMDASREIAVVVYRGSIALTGVPALPDRIVLSLDPAGRAREPAERDSALMRGRFGFTETDAHTHEAENEEEAERLQAARMETWAADAPAPVLSLERYARISAALVEHPSERGRVLATHDLDEATFAIEERAWAERMATEALNGDGRLAERYAALFVERQDALATPEERAMTLYEYARLRAAMEVSEDASQALSEQGVNLASYLRLERRWEAAAKADPAVARELSARVRTFVEELLSKEPV